MNAYICAIDGGSQSTKVSIVDADGVVHASAQVPLRPYELGPAGRAVHPDDDLWDSLTRACRAALDRFDGDASDIVAVGLCGIRFCRAVLDSDGRLVEPIASWMDARVGQPFVDSDEVATVCSAGGYLTVRLTGERRDSAASYQGMWPIDAYARRWSSASEDFERTGMPASKLSELVDPGELLGRVLDDAARQTGLPAQVPVYATGNDKAVEALGAGLLEPGGLLLSLGTYVTSMTVADRMPADDHRYWINSAAVPGQRLIESAGVRRGMWTVSWLRHLVGSAGDATSSQSLDSAEVQQWLETGAWDVPAGCGGLVTLPDWLAPGDAPWRRGAILGLDGSHGPHHLHRSILEGIVLTMVGHAEAMESALAQRSTGIVVTGGGAHSDLMMQIVADVFDRPASRGENPDAAGLGAAICAAVGHGIHRDFPEGVAAMVRPGTAVDPQPSAAQRYAEVRTIYRTARGHLDPFFRELGTLTTHGTDSDVDLS